MNIMNKTQQKIYDEGKKLFYSQGYYNTTVREITKKANANSGLFNYYFKNKYNLAIQICNEIFYKIKKIVEEYFPEEENPAVFAGIMLRMHTYIHNDSRIIKFIIDISKEGILEESILQSTMKLNEKINNYYKKNHDYEYLRFLTAITLASESAAMEQKYKGTVSYDIEKISNIIFKIHLNGFELNESEINACKKNVTKKFNILYNNYSELVNNIIW